jgi:hypothetical protein
VPGRKAQQTREEMGSKRPPAPGGGKIADRRAQFKRLSRQSPRDEEAERAFIEGKMEMVRTDPKSDEGGEAERARGAQAKIAASPAGLRAQSEFPLASGSSWLDHYSSRQSIKMLQGARTSEEPPRQDNPSGLEADIDPRRSAPRRCQRRAKRNSLTSSKIHLKVGAGSRT